MNPRRADDPQGWHDWPAVGGVRLPRARRIDVLPEADGSLRIDSAFQDSAPRPDGSRAVPQEYGCAPRSTPHSG